MKKHILYLLSLFCTILLWTLAENKVKEKEKINDWKSNTSFIDSLYGQAKFDSVHFVIERLKKKYADSSRNMFYLLIYEAKIKGFLNGSKKSIIKLEGIIKRLECEHDYFIKELEFAYRTLGEMLKRVRQHNLSLNIHKKSLKISNDIYGTNSIEIARAHNNYAIANFYLGNMDTAEVHFKRALSIRELAGKKYILDASKQYNNIGVIYLKKKEYFFALFNLKKALRIRRKFLQPSHPLIGSSLLNIGNIYLELGDEVTALLYLNEAVSIRNKTRGNNHSSIAKMLNSIGIAQKRLNRFMEAKSTFSRAIQILKSNANSSTQGVFYLLNLGEVYLLEGDFEKALQIFDRVNDSFLDRKIVSTPENVELYLLMAEAYSKSGDFEQALILFKKALHLDSFIGSNNTSKISRIQLKLAEHYIRTENIPRAEIKLSEALNGALNATNLSKFNDLVYIVLYSKSIDFSLIQEILTLQSNYFEKRINTISNNPLNINSKQGKILKQSLESTFLLLILNLRIKKFSPFIISRQYLSKTNSTDLDKIFLSLVRLKKKKPKYVNKFLNNYFFFLTHLKQPELLRRRELISFFSKQSDSKGDIQSFLKGVSQLDLIIPPSESRNYTLENKFANINLLSQFENASSSYSNIDSLFFLYIDPHHSILNKLSKQKLNLTQMAIKKNEAIIEFFWLNSGIFSLLLTKSRFELFILPTDSINSSELATLRSSILKASLKEKFFDYYSQLDEKLLRIYGNMLDGIEVLTIIPNQTIASIPFDALIDSRNFDQESFRIKVHTIKYHYSIYSQTIERKSSEYKMQKSILSMAPVFRSKFDLKERYDGIRVGLKSHQISPYFLKYSEYEVEEIDKLYNARSLEHNLLLDEKATEKNFKQLASNFQVLHLSTHSFTNSSDPHKSAVLFYPPDKPDEDNDGYLYSHEIESMYIPADLVVLSSCDGAVGQSVPGDGMHSLARSFLMAGAKSVLASLWKVPDKYTSKLMIKFHDYWLRGKSKAAALRQAKLDLMSENPNLPPRFWAGFILIGE